MSREAADCLMGIFGFRRVVDLRDARLLGASGAFPDALPCSPDAERSGSCREPPRARDIDSGAPLPPGLHLDRVRGASARGLRSPRLDRLVVVFPPPGRR